MWIFLKNKVLETRLKKQRTSSRRDGLSFFTENPRRVILGNWVSGVGLLGNPVCATTHSYKPPQKWVVVLAM